MTFCSINSVFFFEHILSRFKEPACLTVWNHFWGSKQRIHFRRTIDLGFRRALHVFVSSSALHVKHTINYSALILQKNAELKHPCAALFAYILILRHCSVVVLEAFGWPGSTLRSLLACCVVDSFSGCSSKCYSLRLFVPVDITVKSLELDPLQMAPAFPGLYWIVHIWLLFGHFQVSTLFGY